jgi:hypothetical protein
VLTDPGRHRFATYELCGADTLTGNPNVLTWLLAREPTSFAEYVSRALGA